MSKRGQRSKGRSKGTAFASNGGGGNLTPNGARKGKKKNTGNRNQYSKPIGPQRPNSRQNRTYSGQRDVVRLRKNKLGQTTETTEDIELAKIKMKGDVKKSRARSAGFIGASSAVSSAASQRSSDPQFEKYKNLSDGGLGTDDNGSGEEKETPESKGQENSKPIAPYGRFE